MTKEECLQILKLLSALEATGMMKDRSLPDYLYEIIDEACKILQREILK